MNTSFQNRGDALMNRAIQQRLGPPHDWSISANVAYVSPGEVRPFRIGLVSGLSGKTAKQRLFNGLVSAGAAVASTLPRSLRRRGRFTVPADIDVAIDVSGYCFGDPWGQERVDQATRNYRRLRAAGAKIVLMPKTWGPFATIDSRSLDRMFDEIDLAFARDERSLGLIQAEISPANRKKLSFAPDYTHAVAPARSVAPAAEKIAYLIPSSRVIDSGALPRDKYFALFASARSQLAAAGLRPKLLIHETSNDMGFAKAAAELGFSSEELEVPSDAIAAKTLISTASAVITSRLHGLYNALNCLVPVAVVAWSFKYEEALKQYHCADCLIDLDDPGESLASLIGKITNSGEIERLKSAMRLGKDESAARTDEMWQKIIDATGLDLTTAEVQR